MPLTWPEPEELVLTADDLNVGLQKARFDQEVARFWEASRNALEVRGTDVKLQLQPYVDQIECQFGNIISAEYYLGLQRSVSREAQYIFAGVVEFYLACIKDNEALSGSVPMREVSADDLIEATQENNCLAAQSAEILSKPVENLLTLPPAEFADDAKLPLVEESPASMVDSTSLFSVEDKNPDRRDVLVLIGPTGVEHYPSVKKVQILSTDGERERAVSPNPHSSMELDDVQGHAHAEESLEFAHAFDSEREPSLSGITEEPLSMSSTLFSCTSGTVPLDSQSTCTEISPSGASCLPGDPDSALEFAPHESNPFTAQQPSCLDADPELEYFDCLTSLSHSESNEVPGPTNEAGSSATPDPLCLPSLCTGGIFPGKACQPTGDPDVATHWCPGMGPPDAELEHQVPDPFATETERFRRLDQPPYPTVKLSSSPGALGSTSSGILATTRMGRNTDNPPCLCPPSVSSGHFAPRKQAKTDYTRCMSKPKMTQSASHSHELSSHIPPVKRDSLYILLFLLLFLGVDLMRTCPSHTETKGRSTHPSKWSIATCSLPFMTHNRQIRRGQCRHVNGTSVKLVRTTLFTAKKPPDNISSPTLGEEGVKGLPVM